MILSVLLAFIGCGGSAPEPRAARDAPPPKHFKNPSAPIDVTPPPKADEPFSATRIGTQAAPFPSAVQQVDAVQVPEHPAVDEAVVVAPIDPATSPSADVAATPDEGENGVFTNGGDHTTVKVFYGTDRLRRDRADELRVMQAWMTPVTFGLAFGTILVALASLRFPERKMRFYVFAGVGALLTSLSGYYLLRTPVITAAEVKASEFYGARRGELDYGECLVTVPNDHRLGVLESPSVFKLEFKEKTADHVILNSVTPQSYSSFRMSLQQTVASSKKSEALIFVHGYNVSFEDAARRTAQIAYDLQFDGAPVFFSWPSQGTVLGYTIDENNVAWATPDVKKFIMQIAQDSGAQSVHLVAHSMGNRALTQSLREIALEHQHNAKVFDQIVLAAPDVDAEIFRRDVAPQIVKTGRHVTLYASSNDRALIASKTVHGYPRAGESGAKLVIAPGIHTIDVSGVDTSLLGHSYYGESHSILADIYFLLTRAIPAAQRFWLSPQKRDGGVYYLFDKERAKVAIPKFPTHR